MGLFGGKNADGSKKKFDWTAAALGFLSPTAGALYSKKAKERREDDAEAAQYQAIRSSLRQENLPDHMIDMFMADPKRVAEYALEKYRTRQGGAEGMTIRSVDPRTGQPSTETTAGWHNGSYFGASNGTTKPPLIHEGVDIVPVQAGGHARAFGAASGRPIPVAELGGGAPPPAPKPGGPTAPVFQPGEVVNGMRFKGGDDEDPANWEPVAQGGAGPAAAPRTFRPGFPY